MPSGVYVRTEYHRQKLSESHKGQVPWIVGLTKETDERVVKMGRGVSKAKKGCAVWITGLTKETDKRVATMAKHLSESRKGEKRLPFSKEWIEHLSESHKGIKYLNRKSAGPLSEDHRRNISRGNKGKIRSKEAKINIGEGSKKKWRNPKFIKKWIEGEKKAKNRKPTKPEIVFDKLTPSNVRYVGNGIWWRMTKKKSARNPDFKVKSQNKVIEIFGDYWHKGENPNELIKEYKEAGIDCIIFWENEVYNERERVLKETLEFVKEE